MKPSDQHVQFLDQYLNDALSPSDATVWAKELESDQEQQDLFLETCRVDALLHAHFTSDDEKEKLSQRVLLCLPSPSEKREQTAARVIDRINVKGFRAGRSKRHRAVTQIRRAASSSGSSILSWFVGLAACLVVGYFVWINQTPSPTMARTEKQIAHIRAIENSGTLTREGNRSPLKNGKGLLAGDAIQLDSGATMALAFDDGSTVHCTGPSSLRLIHHASQNNERPIRGLDLVTGIVQANVKPQGRVRFVVYTPHAQAEVIGTSFSVSVDRRSSKLEVTEGRVAFTRNADKKSLELRAQQVAVVEAGMPFEIAAIAPVKGTSEQPEITQLKTRDPAYWPFASTSPWNQPLGSKARFESEASPGFSLLQGAELNVDRFTHPVFVAKADSPLTQIEVIGGGRKTLDLRIPVHATPLNESLFMHIIEPSHQWVYECMNAKRLRNGSFQATDLFKISLRGSGFLEEDGAGRVSSAAGIGGLIRKHELKQGIPHALALSIISSGINGNGPSGRSCVWPAKAAPSWPELGSSGNLFFGTLLAIPPETDLTRLGIDPQRPVFQVAKALQDYGGYIVESFMSGINHVAVFAEPGTKIGDPASFNADLSRVIRHLKVVANNRPETPGGGGTLRRELAPPLSQNRKGNKTE